MSKNTDNKKPYTDLFDYLPEVNKSEINESFFQNALNRHLTKDDTERVSGYIGQSNPNAIINRQIKEPTPHRQAYQLQPTAYSKLGNQEFSLSFKAFLKQLELMGVDPSRMATWGSSLKFNWVPPINVDMFVNYQNYYWLSTSDSPQPQYFTIENRCNKAQAKVVAYQKILNLYGSSFSVIAIDVINNTLTISGLYQTLFTPGFKFFTKGTSNINFKNKFWTVKTSVSLTNVTNEENCQITAVGQTIITLEEDIAIRSDTPPITTLVGRWWLNTTNNQLFEWNGSSWVPSSSAILVNISLDELLNTYIQQANCVCNGDYGWDLSLWDDNQAPGSVLWIEQNVTTLAHPGGIPFITAISHSTETQWIAEWGPPVAQSIWYDTNDDALKLYTTSWQVVINNFSVILEQITGNTYWDYTVGCDVQEINQWTGQNRWIHKTQVQNFTNVRRAQAPILEYGSTVELNEWTEHIYNWKYRASVDNPWELSTVSPTRLELEPIKSYYATQVGPEWKIYLFTSTETINRDIDYTKIFVPGFRFVIRDNTTLKQFFTVKKSEYRETSVVAGDPSVVAGYMVTIITIQEASFSVGVPVGLDFMGGGPTFFRIEPVVTSKGDLWKGYHVHWLMDLASFTTRPSKPRPWNIFLKRGYDDSTTNVSFSVPEGLLLVAPGRQELTLNVAVPATTLLSLHSSLVYNTSLSNHFALADSGDLRVYINGIRQYGNYSEEVITTYTNYTAVGLSTLLTTIPQKTVIGIRFDIDLNVGDVVRIEVGPAALEDMGYNSVPVRTVEDETEFTAAIVAGTQPEYRSLARYKRTEQNKKQVNQYPLFNVYDVVSDEVIAATPIIAYKEGGSEYGVNTDLQRRVIVSGNNDFVFEHFLIEQEDGKIYGYHDFALLSAIKYWYSPLLNKIFLWDGKAWTDHVVIPITIGMADVVKVFVPVIKDTEPVELLDQPGALWFDTKQYKLKQRTPALVWQIITEVVISDIDPLLRTVWRHGNTNNVYIPQYVDKDRQPITINDPDGDWALPDQWFYNPEHKNRKEIKFSELLTHFKTISASQPPVPGLSGGGIFSLIQSQYNYSLGGTIREYNDSYDTLISAVNVRNITPIGLVNWAEDQYSSLLLMVRDYFEKNIEKLLTDLSIQNFTFFGNFNANKVIEFLQLNDFLSVLYGDSTAFNATEQRGVPNWIATPPMFGLTQKVRPYLNVDNSLDFVELVHHDGHRAQIMFSTAEYDNFAMRIINVPDLRVSGQTFGKQSTLAPPATETSFITAFGGTTVRPGVFWYRLTPLIRTIYRFNIISASPIAPPFIINGKMLPDGTYYYNTGNSTLYKKVGLTWQVVTSLGDGNIAAAWTPVDFRVLLGQTLQDIEQRLYDVTPDYRQLKFDYNILTSTPEDTGVFNDYLQQQFFNFIVERNIRAPFVNSSFSLTNPFTWNYITSTITIPPTSFVSPDPAASWQELYTRWYNTPYPHLEPWKLQGYENKPLWWDEEYLNDNPVVYGQRRWKYIHTTTTGMWENIRLGFIPHGREKPDKTISVPGNDTVPRTYLYFSVNISDGVVGTYQPDDLFPPYLDGTTPGVSLFVRSLFDNFSSQISAPNADFRYGEGSYYEWLWSTSVERVYDWLNIAFRMQPVRFLHSSFGVSFSSVDELQIETLFGEVYSHKDALFHGDLYNTNKTFIAQGLNQWYVNFNRFSGFDVNVEFQKLWVEWEPKLTYQFAGIVDTSTFEITNKFFDVVPQDYNILLVNNGVIRDLWVDAFKVNILNIPPAIIQYNNQARWRFEFSSLAPIARVINYYDVRAYAFKAEIENPLLPPALQEYIGVAFKYDIIEASSPARRFYVRGNQTEIFEPGVTFTVLNSTSNNGNYTVALSVYEPLEDRTRITTEELVPSSTGDGSIQVSNIGLPWNTGDVVAITSTKILPAPLTSNALYYIIKLSPTTFALAESPAEAHAGVRIKLTSPGEGELLIGQVDSTFNVYGGKGSTPLLWYHFALDKTKVRTLSLPTIVTGMQELINIIDGYAAYQIDVNLQSFDTFIAENFDPTTGRPISWQTEIERFIDWAYRLRQSRLVVNDRFEFSVQSISADELKFTTEIPPWLPGEAVIVSASGALPSPLSSSIPYYFVPTSSPDVFKLSYTKNITILTSIVDITSLGSGKLYISRYTPQINFPSFEINPSRNNIVINTPQGVLSNVIQGPYPDIHLRQTIFDQYGRPLDATSLQFYRLDKQTKIAILPQLKNDVEPQPSEPTLADPYNYLHIGGGHFFVEGYEHFIIFNDYTVTKSLIYDAFLGLRVQKFDLDYFEAKDYTLRPTLGGFYLLNNKFYRNIEGSVVDMQNYYDVYGISENNPVAKRSRNLLGYEGKVDYLNLLNANSKTQFLFYKGMIQSKGSVNSIKAYINSRRFIDAQVDEYWAWKLAEFGDNRPKIYPEINLLESDVDKSSIRLMFLSSEDDPDAPDVTDARKKGFDIVTFATEQRWPDFPEQRTILDNNPLFLDASISSMTRIYANDTPPLLGQEHFMDYWYDTSSSTLMSWDGSSWQQVTPNRIVVEKTFDLYVRLPVSSDGVRVIRRVPDVLNDLQSYTNQILEEGTSVNQFQRINSEIIRFTPADFTGLFLIFTLNIGKEKINPAKLIDTKTGTVVSQVPIWDPARGLHYWEAIHNVDLQLATDPARYTDPLNPNDKINPSWNYTEVGKIWLDTSAMSYFPYYDDKIYTDLNDRLFNWGKLSDWGNIRVFQWVESRVPPEQWDDLVLSQQNNSTIPQHLKPTGSVRKGVFKRTREPQYVMTSGDVNVLLDTLTVSGSGFKLNQPVVLRPTEDAGVLPAPLVVGQKYYVVDVPNDNSPHATFKLSTEPQIGVANVIDIIDQGDLASGFFKVAPLFESTSWIEKPIISEKFYPVLDLTINLIVNASPTFSTKMEQITETTGSGTMTVTYIELDPLKGWQANDEARVFVNGKLFADGLKVTQVFSSPLYVRVEGTFNNGEDFVEVIRPLHILTDEEIQFDPDVEDDGSRDVQWKEATQFSTAIVNQNGRAEQRWYFWVENVTTKRNPSNNSSMPALAIQQTLANIPTPYLALLYPKDDPVLVRRFGWGTSPYGMVYPISLLTDEFVFIPVFYRQVVLNKAYDYVTTGDRFIIRFTRDLSLRDDLTVNGRNLNLKNKHQEWLLIRRAQQTNIPLQLWNSLIECIIGHKIDDPSIRVPSLERELYDAANNTQTRFGLGKDQAFADGNLALKTVLAYLQDPSVDFYPIDINNFFATNTFDTKENIKNALIEIYNTFGAKHVNAIWFNVLLDALSTKSKYKEIMKTSWVTIYGVRVLDVGGLFDD